LAANSKPPSEQLRLFVAIELEPGVREALARVQDELRKRPLPSLRWVRPEGIHLTLKFLGETPADLVPAIESALAEAVAGLSPFQVALGPLGTFGGRRPRVLWVDVTGDVDRLKELQERVERALAPLGVPREERAYSPHLTLARLPPSAAAGPALEEALAAVPPPEAAMEAREVSLVLSRLQPGGAVYERLADFPLNKGAAPGVE
jgi:2'-5' RNA ligase